MKWCSVKIQIHRKIAMRMLSRLSLVFSILLCGYCSIQACCPTVRFLKVSNTGRLRRILTRWGYIWKALEWVIFFLTTLHSSLTKAYVTHIVVIITTISKRRFTPVAFSNLTWYDPADCWDVFIYKCLQQAILWANVDKQTAEKNSWFLCVMVKIGGYETLCSYTIRAERCQPTRSLKRLLAFDLGGHHPNPFEFYLPRILPHYPRRRFDNKSISIRWRNGSTLFFFRKRKCLQPLHAVIFL